MYSAMAEWLNVLSTVMGFGVMFAGAGALATMFWMLGLSKPARKKRK